jgi:DNA modification methylase
MLLIGDCIEQMRTLEADSVDAIVTDPPYGLEFMGKQWDGFGTPLGFQTWSEQWAREALRVLKPGGHLLAFGGTRMYHRLAAGIEDAGFEIRDTLMWLYGSGFPKSHNLKGEWQGWGTALKPAVEPIVLARKPLIGTVVGNVLTHGTGALNIDASRIGTRDKDESGWAKTGSKASQNVALGNQYDREPISEIGLGRWPANILLDEEAAALLDEQSGVSKSAPAKGHNRLGNLIGDGRSAKSAGLYGDGAWISGSNHNDTGGASRFFYVAKASRSERNAGLDGFEEKVAGVLDHRKSGDFHQRLVDSVEPKMARNIHPTVKPLALMKYLIRLVVPKGGVVLDPFLGSGTTAVAAIEEGVEWIGCEREAEYVEIIKARVAAAQPGFGLTLDEAQG